MSRPHYDLDSAADLVIDVDFDELDTDHVCPEWYDCAACAALDED